MDGPIPTFREVLFTSTDGLYGQQIDLTKSAWVCPCGKDMQMTGGMSTALAMYYRYACGTGHLWTHDTTHGEWLDTLSETHTRPTIPQHGHHEPAGGAATPEGAPPINADVLKEDFTR